MEELIKLEFKEKPVLAFFSFFVLGFCFSYFLPISRNLFNSIVSLWSVSSRLTIFWTRSDFPSEKKKISRGIRLFYFSVLSFSFFFIFLFFCFWIPLSFFIFYFSSWLRFLYYYFIYFIVRFLSFSFFFYFFFSFWFWVFLLFIYFSVFELLSFLFFFSYQLLQSS